MHLFIFLVLMKSDFLYRISAKVGLKDPAPEITQHYKQMIKFHLRMDGNIPEKSVLFIGASIVQGLCVSDVINPSVNFGIGNDTTVGVLRRIPQYTSIKRAMAVVFNIGGNDMRRRKNEKIIENFRKIISKISINTPIIFTSVFPVDEKITTTRNNRRIVELNKKMKILCASFKNCHFVDSNKKFIDIAGNLNHKFHVGDGIHLNAEGYRIWINDLKNTLNSVL